MTTSQPQMPADLLSLLRQSLFLENLPDDQLRVLAELATQVEVGVGERIFREGDSASEAYLIVGGRVVLEICAAGVGCKQICTLTAGELLGWSPLLDQTRYTATARAMEPTRMIRLDAKRLREECERNVALGYEILRRTGNALAKRLSAARLQLIDVYGTKMPEAGASHGDLSQEISQENGAE